jgi:ABC superfamily ATP binding cassette transporter, ABC protein
MIASSLSKKAHIFIWDEPLNYIDVMSRIQLEELILSTKPTLIFIEHDEEFANNIRTKELKLTNTINVIL